jgi:hypothetical protein
MGFSIFFKCDQIKETLKYTMFSVKNIISVKFFLCLCYKENQLVWSYFSQGGKTHLNLEHVNKKKTNSPIDP